jgi:hypothetical protein
VALSVIIGVFVLLGCDGGGGDDFRAVTATDLQNTQNQTFTFDDGTAFDPSLAGQTVTLTTGTTDAAGAMIFSLTSSGGAVVGGTIAANASCTIHLTLQAVAGAAPQAIDQTTVADPCEVEEGTGRLRFTVNGQEFVSNPPSAATDVLNLTVALSPANEVTPATPLDDRPETGTATLRLLSGNILEYTIMVDSLTAGDALTNSHIHYPSGGPTQNGPVFITLVGAPVQFGRTTDIQFNGATSATGTIVLTPDEAAQLQEVSEPAYVNVHSTQAASGLLRGQLREQIALAFNTALSPLSEVPPLTGRPESGTATLRLLADNTLIYTLAVNGLTVGDALTNSHIHMGNSTEAGPVYITLVGEPVQNDRTTTIAFNGATTVTAQITLTPDEVTVLNDPNQPLYVNIHSLEASLGLVRGQLRDAAVLPPTTTTPVSFANDVQPIFTQNCAIAGCHAGASPPPSSKPLNLEAGQAFANLVGVLSGERPLLMRVAPGDPLNSYLYQKHTGAAGIGGSRMPLNNPTFFDDHPDLLGLERRWIEEGALDN